MRGPPGAPGRPRAGAWEEGSGLFGRQDPAALERFRRAVGGELQLLDDRAVGMIVDTSVQRLRCWASVQQMHEAGTQWLEIWAILDGRTSAICREMHGRIISVGQAAAAVDWLASLEPGAFAVQLRNRPAEDDLVAEIRRRGTEALGSAHLLPPYHPRCRTRVKRAAGPPPSPGLPPEGLNAEQERAWSYWQGLPEKARPGPADAARAEFRPARSPDTPGGIGRLETTIKPFGSYSPLRSGCWCAWRPTGPTSWGSWAGMKTTGNLA